MAEPPVIDGGGSIEAIAGDPETTHVEHAAVNDLISSVPLHSVILSTATSGSGLRS